MKRLETSGAGLACRNGGRLDAGGRTSRLHQRPAFAPNDSIVPRHHRERADEPEHGHDDEAADEEPVKDLSQHVCRGCNAEVARAGDEDHALHCPWRTQQRARRRVRSSRTTRESHVDIADKVIIITGASEGIGLATARLFAREGAKLALAARSADKLERIAAELPDAIAIPTDMRDEQAVQRMVTRAHERYGRIDVLVNNAGQGLHVPIEQVNLRQYRAVFELNVVGVIAAMQAVVPLMRAQGGGVIVNVSSGTSKMVLPGVGPYASTKYALNAVSLTARQELAPENIRVGLVHPGITATEFHNHLANGTTWSGPRGRAGATAMPVDTPEHVAEKILEAVRTEAAEVYADSIRR